MAMGVLACGMIVWTASALAMDPVEVLVPANSPRFAIAVVAPSGPVGGGAWPEGDGPMPAIRAALADPTITRSQLEGPQRGEPTKEGLRHGTVHVTLMKFESIEDLPEAMRSAASSLNEPSHATDPFVGPPVPNMSPPRRAYRHVLVIVDRWTNDEATLATIRAARDELIWKPSDADPPVHGRGSIDQINTIALIRQDTGQVTSREAVKATLADSFITFTPVPANPGPGVEQEKNLAMVGHSAPTTGAVGPWLWVDTNFHPTLSKYEWTLQQMFKRMTVCPSDFDRDGTTEGPFPTGDDADAFITDYSSQLPYADWNFDESQDLVPSPTIGNNGDWAKFNAGFDPLTGCPNN
jgi:hypothetical protein